MKRVVVGLSGGVDSSVAAYLLIQQGYEVIGLFMKNWHDETVTLSNDCPWIDDSNDALLVAQHLGIPFQVIDLSVEYKDRIVDYMFSEYESGRTPNPDVLCNREIKFDVFLKEAQALGADFVATGHYCRKFIHEDERHGILSGKDGNKDQSYFLCQVNSDQLKHALFPIGDLQKSEVRKIAMENGLVTAEKRDSQGLCFVGKISLPQFLQQKLAPKTGEVIEISSTMDIYKAYAKIPRTKEHLVELATPFHYKKSDGAVVAAHQGAHYYTIGQRRGLHIGGRPKPSFVLATDTQENVIYSGQEDNHPGLYRWALSLELSSLVWIQTISEKELIDGFDCQCRIRYRQALQKAKIYLWVGRLFILFETAQRGITPGQFAAWYVDEKLMGSACIEH